MNKAIQLIEAGHQCQVLEAGYYWAQMILWEEHPRARAQRKLHESRRHSYPMLCSPRIVELVYMDLPPGRPKLLCSIMPQERIQDWLFLSRIEAHPAYVPSACKLDPLYAHLLAGPKRP